MVPLVSGALFSSSTWVPGETCGPFTPDAWRDDLVWRWRVGRKQSRTWGLAFPVASGHWQEQNCDLWKTPQWSAEAAWEEEWWAFWAGYGHKVHMWTLKRAGDPKACPLLFLSESGEGWDLWVLVYTAEPSGTSGWSGGAGAEVQKGR